MKETETAMHLIVDGYGNNPELFANEGLIYQLLDQYPAEIGLTKIAPPFVFKYVGKVNPANWGVSGVVLVAESHIGIHTWVERRFVNIDIFSCKSFDAHRIVKDLCSRLQLTELKFRLLERSTGKLNLLEEGDGVPL